VELCEQAAAEQDPHKMLELVTEINDLLEQKERRLGILPAQNTKSGSQPLRGESETR